MVVDREAEFEDGVRSASNETQQVCLSPTHAMTPAHPQDGAPVFQSSLPYHPTILLRPWHCAYHGIDAIRELVPRQGSHEVLKAALLNAWRWEMGVRNQIAALVTSGEDSRTMEEVDAIEVGCDVWFHRRSLPVFRARAKPDFMVTFLADRMQPHFCEWLDVLASSIIDASAQQTRRSPLAQPTQEVAAVVHSGNHL